MSPAAEPELNRVLLGDARPEPEPLRLSAGALTAEFVDGALRHIRHDGVEVLRAIAYLVRDPDWGTAVSEITGLEIDQGAAGFSVRYAARCLGPAGEALDYAARIEASEGRLRFAVEATPETDFLTARLGFTVLHPIVSVAGQPVEVAHGDGWIEQARFPELIDPWQPFQDIAALTHAPAPGLLARCAFEGGTFEMEDHRNWSDASFKTYVRPLALPWPYVVAAGETDRQAVTLTVQRQGSAPPPARADGPIRITVGEGSGGFPRLGLVVTPEEGAAAVRQAAALRRLAPGALLFHYDPTAGHGRREMAALAAVAGLTKAEATLELVVPCERDLDAELGDAARAVADAGLRLSAVAVSPSVDRQSTPPGSAWPDCPPLEEVYAAARRAFPGLPLGGGSFAYFTELNRKRPPVELLDFVTHATCPIVHAADDVSVMQTLQALPAITASARAIIGADTPYRLGPATLGMRQNPYGARTFDNPEARRLCMVHDDPRQGGLFAAAWMAGYWANVVDAGIEVLTVGALTGSFGLLDPEGEPRPAFIAATWLARLARQTRLACASARPDRVAVLAARDAVGAVSILLANLTAAGQRVSLHRPGPGAWTMAELAATTWPSRPERAVDPRLPLTLGPYGVALLRSEAAR